MTNIETCTILYGEQSAIDLKFALIKCVILDDLKFAPIKCIILDLPNSLGWTFLMTDALPYVNNVSYRA